MTWDPFELFFCLKFFPEKGALNNQEKYFDDVTWFLFIDTVKKVQKKINIVVRIGKDLILLSFY